MSVRSNDAEVDRILRRALADRLVDDPAAAATFSLRVAEQHRQERRQDLHLLYHGHHVVARSHGVSRLVQVLLAHLSTWDRAERTDLLRLHVAGFVHGRQAVLVPIRLGILLESRLAAQGYRSIDGPWVTVDPRTGEVDVAEHSLTLDSEGLGRPGKRWPPSAHERWGAEQGRYTLCLLAMDEVRDDRPAGPGLTLVGAATLLIGVDRSDAGPALEALASLLASTPVVPAYPLDELMAVTREMAGPRNVLK